MGLRHDGITDDSRELQRIHDLYTGSVPLPDFVLTPGTYVLSSSVTVTRPLVAPHGVRLRPSQTSTIYVMNRVDAGNYQIFDFSALGSVQFYDYNVTPTTNNKIREYRAEWFGVKGDSTTDDQPALTNMIASVPNFSTIRLGTGMKIRINNTWNIPLRSGINIYADGGLVFDGIASDINSTYMLWGGPSGSPMINLDRCGHMRFRGFGMDAGSSYLPFSASTAAGCINMTMSGSGRIGTECVFEDMMFIGPQRAKGWYGVAIDYSPTNGNNEEYHKFYRCSFVGTLGGLCQSFANANTGFGAYVGQLSGSIAIASGSNLVTINNPGQNPVKTWNSASLGDQYKRIRIDAASSGSFMLDTRIASISSSTQAFLDRAASNTVTASYWLLDESYGYGLIIGPSFNAKRIVIEDCHFLSLNVGIFAQGGSHVGFRNNFSDNEVNIWVDNTQSEPSVDIHSNSEQSRQHLFHFSPTSFKVSYGRYSPYKQTPLTPQFSGWFALQAGNILIEGCTFDQWPVSGNMIYDLRNSGGVALEIIHPEYGGGMVNDWILGFYPSGSLNATGSVNNGVSVHEVGTYDNAYQGTTTKYNGRWITSSPNGSSDGHFHTTGNWYWDARRQPQDLYFGLGRFTMYADEGNNRIMVRYHKQDGTFWTGSIQLGQ